MLATYVVLLGADAGLTEDAPTGSKQVERSSNVAGAQNINVVKLPERNGMYKLTITSKADSVVINDVVVNRSACHHEFIGSHQLRFGETTEIFAFCNPIEVQVSTGAGRLSFSWQR